MIITRRRHKHTISFGERLHRAADQARQEAQQLPEGVRRDLLMKKASQAEIAAHINEWVTSPGARSPR